MSTEPTTAARRKAVELFDSHLANARKRSPFDRCDFAYTFPISDCETALIFAKMVRGKYEIDQVREEVCVCWDHRALCEAMFAVDQGIDQADMSAPVNQTLFLLAYPEFINREAQSGPSA